MGSVMACNINRLVVQGETLVWHTGLPGEGGHRTSPPFSYGGREWCFRFRHHGGFGLYHSIWLHLLDADGGIEEKYEDLTDGFDVHVQMLHVTEGDKVVGDVWNWTVCATPQWLWWSRVDSDIYGGEDSDEAIFRTLDWLRDLPEVKFACRFPAPPTIPTDKDKLVEEVKSLKDEIKTLQKTVQQQGLESENYEKKIISLQNENLSIANEYKCQFEEKMTFISELEKDKEKLVENLESLKDRINILQKTVQQQALESENFKRTADECKCLLEEKMTSISRLEKACLEHELHKKEMESLLDQMKTLQTTIENNRTPPEKPTSPARIELISDGEQTERQDESTIVSGLEIAAFGGEAAEENNMDGEKGESGNGKKVKQQSRVKSTPKISLPARHDDVICSLKSVLASGSRSDFTLKSGGGKKWAVHRAVLEGRSGHLDALLRGAEIRLDDVTGDAMDGLVPFLYAGEVGRSGNVNEILAAAHELNLEDLESLCVDCLGEWMCPELVCAALVAARVRDEGDLRARALDCYFRERSRVHATEGWRDLKENHPDIVAGLFQEFVTRFGKDNKMSLCAERDSTSS